VALAAALSEVSIYTNATLFAIAAVTTAPIAWLFLKPKHSMTDGSSTADDITAV